MSISIPMILPGHQRVEVHSPRRRFRAGYEAATSSDELSKHFQYANGSDAEAAADPHKRQILRNRCRYEVMNNGYLRGMLNTLADHVVGTGPRPHLPHIQNRSDRQSVIQQWNEWAEETDLAGKLRICRMSRAESGEVFVAMVNSPRMSSKIKLDVRIIEADQVHTPGLWLANQTIDGMELDRHGRPKVYHVLRSHPGSNYTWHKGTPMEFDRVSARHFLHWSHVTRPGQFRGIPEVAATLAVWAGFRRFLYATLAAAETAADFAAVMESTEPANGDADAPQMLDLVELTQRMATVLPQGYRLNQVKAEHPNATIGEFTRITVSQAARIWSMPYSVAIGDSSESNFASARLDHKPYFFARKIEQRDLEIKLLKPIWKQWLLEASLVEGLLPQSMRMAHGMERFPAQWLWTVQDDHEPRERANAQELRLSMATTTLAREAAADGQDWEDLVEQRALEVKRLKALGLQGDTTPADEEASAPAPAPGSVHAPVEQEVNRGDA